MWDEDPWGEPWREVPPEGGYVTVELRHERGKLWARVPEPVARVLEPLDAAGWQLVVAGLGGFSLACGVVYLFAVEPPWGIAWFLPALMGFSVSGMFWLFLVANFGPHLGGERRPRKKLSRRWERTSRR